MDNYYIDMKIPISPMPAPRPKGKVARIGEKLVCQFYNDEDYMKYKREIARLLKEQGFYDDEKLPIIVSHPEGIALSIEFNVAFRGWQRHASTTFAITKPDVDNLAKGFIDAMFESEDMPKNILTGKKINDARVVLLQAIKTKVQDKDDKGYIRFKIESAERYLERKGF